MFKNKYILACISGLILYISWPPMVFPFFILIGLVPLLMIEQHFHEHPIKRGSWKLLGYLYLAFLIWNILTTWWVYNASPAAIIAISLNSFFMCVPFILYHHTRKKLNHFWSFIALVSYWLAFEHLHLRWDISWPWLTLGNAFAKWPSVVQWYEYTGFIGGTVWVWAVNILVFGLYLNYTKGQVENNILKKSAIVDLVIIIPIAVSMLIYKTYKPSEQSIKVMVVQPNLDPYTEKFNGLPADEQLMRMISLAESKLDSNVKLLILPETAITSVADEMDLNYNEEVRMIKRFLMNHPKLEVLTGISTYKLYAKNEEISSTARDQGNGQFADFYNTAIYIVNAKPIQIYHKSKLVPGVEKMPFPYLLKFLEKYSINNGGISGSLGVDKEPKVMMGVHAKVGPVICYESIYGDYVRQYVKNGSNLISIITNDGWWGNTDGYKQHLNYASLRAIETRRSIARSANTGISGFIDERGDLYKQSEWWQPEVLTANVTLNEQLTFYSMTGDYISVIGIFMGLILGVLSIFKSKKVIQGKIDTTNKINE